MEKLQLIIKMKEKELLRKLVILFAKFVSLLNLSKSLSYVSFKNINKSFLTNEFNDLINSVP
jgi:hypothetical protein